MPNRLVRINTILKPQHGKRDFVLHYERTRKYRPPPPCGGRGRIVRPPRRGEGDDRFF